MSETVQLTVQSDLAKIVADLQALQRRAASTGDQIKRIGTELDSNLQRNTKKTEQHFERLRDLGRRMADQLRGYFASVARDSAYAMEGFKRDLGLRKQFHDATAGAVEFHTVLQRIGTTLQLSGDRLGEFQRAATNAFAAIGLSQSDAAQALAGVAQTQVRGEKNVIDYGTTAAQLGQLNGNPQAAGEIARAIADAIRAKGGDVNNTATMRAFAEDARRVYNATGQAPLDTLHRQGQLFEGMSPEERKQMGSGGAGRLAAVGAVVGPQFDSLVTHLTDKALNNLGAKAQGFKGLISDKGVDFDRLNKIAPIGKRIGFDQISSFQTALGSEDAAKGLVRLIEQRDAAKAAQQRYGAEGGTLGDQAFDSRGLPENATAIKNRAGAFIGNVVTPAVDLANKAAGKASQSDIGSIVTMGAGFAGAALAAGGLAKIGKVLGPKLGGAGAFAESGAKAAALEQLTGQKTIPVYVVNVGEFALGGGVPQLGGAIGDAAKAAGGGAAGAAMTTAIATAIPIAIAAAGAYAAYEVENKAAKDGKTLSMNDYSGGAKGGGSIALLVDVFKQLLVKMQTSNDIGRERNDQGRRSQLNRDAPTENRGTSFANVRREP